MMHTMSPTSRGSCCSPWPAKLNRTGGGGKTEDKEEREEVYVGEGMKEWRENWKEVERRGSGKYSKWSILKVSCTSWDKQLTEL